MNCLLIVAASVSFLGVPGWLVWTILFVVFLITELATVSLATIWFLPGTILGFGLYFAGVPFWGQALAMLLVSILMFLIYFVYRRKNKTVFRKRYSTNADRLIGGRAQVIERISQIPEGGAIKISGQIWSARMTEEYRDMVIEVGETVVFWGISGNKALVKPADPEPDLADLPKTVDPAAGQFLDKQN